MPYRLLARFQSLFEGHPYRHRNSSLGDSVAIQLYEDLVALDRSAELHRRISSHQWGLNTANVRQGIRARRGDGTFGEIVPGVRVRLEQGYTVARGNIATVEIGVEVKILAKAMIKQIDRVISDLQKQVGHFQHRGGHPICVAVVGINSAPYCTSYEGERAYKTDGKEHTHPFQEAPEAEQRLLTRAAPHFDEFIFLRYRAINEPPFLFEWTDYSLTEQDYGAALLRICREYEYRFHR